MKFRIACPNVAFVVREGELARHPKMAKLELLGFTFEPRTDRAGVKFYRCEQVMEKEMTTLEEFMGFLAEINLTALVSPEGHILFET